MSMRKIIFLDFDGVLHPGGIGTFSQLPIFELYISAMSEAEIVISSTWREAYTIKELRGFFSPPFQGQIVGVTPSLDNGRDLGGRQKEIQAYLMGNGLSDKNCAWIAIDDKASFFKDTCQNLLLTDTSRGFTEREGRQLLDWYNRVKAG